MKIKRLLPALLVVFFVGSLLSSVNASEKRTVSIRPIADSFVTSADKYLNFGKELSSYSYFKRTHVSVTSRSFAAGTTKIELIPIYSLFEGSSFSGSFTVTSGGNKDVNFFISSQGKKFLYLERVTSYSFLFVSPTTEDYFLGFDNTFSVITSKGISLSDVIRTDYGIYASPIFMMFDLSEIPPEATILSAKLRFYVLTASESSTIGFYYCSNNNWGETEITYYEAPIKDIKPESTSQIFVDSAKKWYEMDIKADVVRGLVQGKLTEILAVSNGGMVEIASRESENRPELEITYDYVSVSSAVSPTTIIEGQSIGLNVNTDPSQTEGNIKIQYSKDQINWLDISSFSGGSTYYAWTPSVTGQIYVRALWEIHWERGSYSTPSSVISIFAIPNYLLMLIPTIIGAAVIGTYYWRKRKKALSK